MKNLELRSSLYKSGIILILFVFLIYSFAGSNSGGITGTIGSLFSGILFLLGLILAVAVSVLVMFGIYFGILYIYDKDTCSKTYDEFKSKVGNLSGSCGCSFHSTCSPSEELIQPISDEDLNPLRNNQKNLDNQLSDLQRNVQSLEKTLSTLLLSIAGTAEEMTNLKERANSVEESLEGKATSDAVADTATKLGSDIAALQTSVKPLAEQLAEVETSLSALSSEKDNTDNQLQESVDTAINSIKDELASLRTSIESHPDQLSKKVASSDEETGIHRILSYFGSKSDEKKFVDLVAQAVGEEMTYAQTGGLLNDSLSAEAAEIIADHPSLTKDYIRLSRQKK